MRDDQVLCLMSDTTPEQQARLCNHEWTAAVAVIVRPDGSTSEGVYFCACCGTVRNIPASDAPDVRGEVRLPPPDDSLAGTEYGPLRPVIDVPDNANVCPSCGHDGLPPLVCEHCGHRWYATPAPLDALCGATLTCALPILHDGDHERADGIRWTWPATPAPLDEGRLARALFVICAACEPGEEYTDNHHRRHAEAIAAAYAEEAPDEGNEWQERNE